MPRLFLSFLISFAICGCTTSRTGDIASCRVNYEFASTPKSESGLVLNQYLDNPVDRPGVLRLRSTPVRKTSDTLASSFKRRLTFRKESNSEFRVLVLSTGGAWGAYGAGFLKGLSESTDIVDHKYDLVTGSSTGALIAPFAFLGEKSDYDHINQLYLNLTDDQILARRPLFTLVRASSIFDTRRMRSFVIQSLRTYRVVERVAKEAEAGRVLAVMAVNVDTGQLEVFDLTAVASDASISMEQRINMFADRVLASAAIPIAFEPIFLEGCMYIDAGARRNVFVTSEFAAEYVRSGGRKVSEEANRSGGRDLIIDLMQSSRGNAPRVRVDIIVNGEASLERQVTKLGIRPIVLRTVPIIMNSTMWASLSRISDVSVPLGWKLNYRDAYTFSYQDNGSAFSLSGEVFDAEFMRRLNEFGYLLAQKNEPWEDMPGSPDPLK